ncbi:MAG TPA: AMP-binding protein [Roseiflexaceae bacterium]
MSANEPAAQQTLNDLFDTSLITHASSNATRYLPSARWAGQLTYDHLAGHVERFADALYLLDVRKDDYVALALPSSPQYIIAFFAALRLGAVIANCDPAASAAELRVQLAACGAETIVVINDCWPRLQEIRRATALKWAIVAYPDDTLPRPLRWLARDQLRRSGGWIDVRREERTYFFQEMLDFATQPAPPIAVAPDDRALVQYLEAASAPPPSAPFTHHDLVRRATTGIEQVIDGAVRHEPKRVRPVAPFYRLDGLVGMLHALALGDELAIGRDDRRCATSCEHPPPITIIGTGDATMELPTATIPVGASVYCTDGYGGILTQLVIDPVARRVTHIVVQDGALQALDHLVPVERIASAARDRVILDCTQADLSTFEPFTEAHYIRSGAKDFYEVYAFYPYAEFEAENIPVVDEHIPRGELTIRRGARVEANDGPAGMVAEFVVDRASGAISHIVVQRGHLFGRQERAVPVTAIRRISSATVSLNMSRDDVDALPTIPLRRRYTWDETSFKPERQS